MSILASAYGPTDGLTHEPTSDHTADDIADRLTKELRHAREILKTVDLCDVKALLSHRSARESYPPRAVRSREMLNAGELRALVTDERAVLKARQTEGWPAVSERAVG